MLNFLRKNECARWLAILALCLWVISLAQIGLVYYPSYAENTPMIARGVEILFWGWAGVLIPSPAWIANLTFLLAVHTIFSNPGKPATALSISSALMALDTFRISELSSFLGRGEIIYGYGIGVAFWLSAMVILMAAAGVRNIELSENGVVGSKLLQIPLTLVATASLAALFIASILWHQKDTNGASKSELRYLQDAWVKRGVVCKERVAPPQAILSLDGPLEIVGNGYPLDSIHLYLSSGVPIVRRQGWDYFMADRVEMNSVATRRAFGAASVRLSIEEKSPSGGHYRELRATLTKADGSRVGFDQSWTRSGIYGPLYCPDLFSENAEVSDIPPGLAVWALRAVAPLNPPIDISMRKMFDGLSWPPLKAQLLETKAVGGEYQLNASPGCASDVGFMPQSTVPSAAIGVGLGNHSFRVGETFHLFNFENQLQVACSDQAAFLFHISGSRDPQVGVIISAEKKSLPEFQREWTTRVEVPYFGKIWKVGDAGKGTLVGTIAVKSVQERRGTVVLELVNNQTSELLRIQFDVPSRTVQGK